MLFAYFHIHHINVLFTYKHYRWNIIDLRLQTWKKISYQNVRTISTCYCHQRHVWRARDIRRGLLLMYILTRYNLFYGCPAKTSIIILHVLCIFANRGIFNEFYIYIHHVLMAKVFILVKYYCLSQNFVEFCKFHI